MWIVIGLLGLGLVIFVHELGHLLVAKLCRIPVKTFSIGFGPSLYSFAFHGTLYRIAWIPLGGYCQLEDKSIISSLLGGNSAEPAPSFSILDWVKHSSILLAGALFNMVFALVIFVLVQMVGYQEIVFSNRIAVLEQAIPTPLQEVGIQTGDVLLAINGQRVESFSDILPILQHIQEQELLTLLIEKEGVQHTHTILPIWDHQTERPLLGIKPFIPPVLGRLDSVYLEVLGFQEGQELLSLNGIPLRDSAELFPLLEEASYPLIFRVLSQREELDIVVSELYPKEDLQFSFVLPSTVVKVDSFGESVRGGVQQITDTVFASLWGMYSLITLRTEVLESLMGPVGIVKVVGESVTNPTWSGGLHLVTRWLWVLAHLSTVLFVMNLLPIPPLDGGILILLTLKKWVPILPKKFYTAYYYLGVLFVVLLIFLALVGDLFRIA